MTGRYQNSIYTEAKPVLPMSPTHTRGRAREKAIHTPVHQRSTNKQPTTEYVSDQSQSQSCSPSGKDRRPPPDRCMTATYRVAEPNSIHATLAQQGGAEYSPTTSPNHDHPTDQVPYVGLFSRAWETSSSRGQRLQLSFNSEGTRNARQVTGFPGGPAYLGQAETAIAQAIP